VNKICTGSDVRYAAALLRRSFRLKGPAIIANRQFEFAVGRSVDMHLDHIGIRMACDVRQYFLCNSIDLQLHVHGEVDSLFDVVSRTEASILDRVVKQEFKRRDEPDVFENGRA